MPAQVGQSSEGLEGNACGSRQNVKMANAWATASAQWGGGTTNIRRPPELPPTWSHLLHPNFIGVRPFHPKGRPELREGSVTEGGGAPIFCRVTRQGGRSVKTPRTLCARFGLLHRSIVRARVIQMPLRELDHDGLSGLSCATGKGCIANLLDGRSTGSATCPATKTRVDLAYRWEPSVGAGKDGEYLFIAQHIARANDHDTAQLTPKLPKGIRVTNNGALTRPAPFSLAS
jgi:hypothetical protein